MQNYKLLTKTRIKNIIITIIYDKIVLGMCERELFVCVHIVCSVCVKVFESELARSVNNK